jgi:hypothetical protein
MSAKMCPTCMAREADPSEYHDDACPVFQEQRAYEVGHAEGFRAGVEAAAKALDDANAADEKRVPGDSMVKALVLTIRREHAKEIRALAPDAQPRGEGARCACTHEAGDSPCPVHGMDEPGEGACASCGGTGLGAGRSPLTTKKCAECGGTGLAPLHPRDSGLLGRLPCPACGGSGRGDK